MRQQIAGRRVDTLDYVHSMLAQLRTMAEGEKCQMLAYLIEMAYLEATEVMRVTRPSRIHEEKRNHPS